MKCFALTGGIACGKSTISAMLKRKGIPVIDADLLSREAVLPGSIGINKISRVFGAEYLDKNGSLDRKKIAKLVFSDKNARKKLESIVHPLVAMNLQAELLKYQNKNTPFVVYDSPLIFEKGLEKLFDATILVTCEEAAQISRLMKRDGMTKEEAVNRIGSQMSTEEKSKQTSYIIDNSNSEEDTYAQLKSIWLSLTTQNI